MTLIPPKISLMPLITEMLRETSKVSEDKPLAAKSSIFGETPLEQEMASQDTTLHDKAMGRSVHIVPGDTQFPSVTFLISRFVESLNKCLSENFRQTDGCWLKGSSVTEEFPMDTDIAACVEGPDWETIANSFFANFLKDHRDKSSVQGSVSARIFEHWLPVSMYFNSLPITGKNSTDIIFIIYKAPGFDITLFRQRPPRWSIGTMDGKWIKCFGDKTRFSLGTRFAVTAQEIDNAKYDIAFHRNTINDAKNVHNLLFRYVLDLTRQAVVTLPETQKVVAEAIFQERSIEAFTKRWITLDHEHYDNDTSRVIHFLNLLQIYQFNEYAVSFIANSWSNVCHAQKMTGGMELTNLIIACPRIVPHLIAFMQGSLLLLQSGNRAYNFHFNDKQIRPFVAIKAGKHTHYLRLPERQNSPIQMSQLLLSSYKEIVEVAKQFEKKIGYQDLNFLTGILFAFGFDSKFVGTDGKEQIIKELQRFFNSEEVHEMQQLFGPNPTVKEFCNKFLPALAPRFEFKESKRPAESKRLALTTTSISETIIPSAAQAPLKSKDEPILKLINDYEGVAKENNLIAMLDVISLMRSLINSESSVGERDTKEQPEILIKLMEKSKDLLSSNEKLEILGKSYYKDFLGCLLPIVFSKVIQHPTPALFENICVFYMLIGENNCFTGLQEQTIVNELVSAWNSMSPAIDSSFYNKGCELICNSIKKGLLGEKEKILIAFSRLAETRNPEYLRVSYSQLNQILTHEQDDHLVKVIAPLLQNTTLSNSPDLFRIMCKSLISIRKHKNVFFERLMKEIGPQIGPEILKSIETLAPTLKYNGDEGLLFDTIRNVLETRGNPTIIKGAVSAFDALLFHKSKVQTYESPIKHYEREGMIAKQLLTHFSTTKSFAWAHHSIRDRWMDCIALKLTAVTPRQAESLDGTSSNRFRELGLELLNLLKATSIDAEFHKQIQEALPKIVLVKKIESPKDNSIDKVQQAAQSLIQLLSNVNVKDKNRNQKISTITEKILTSIQEIPPKELEELSKELHGKIIEDITKVQALLSNEKNSLAAANGIYQIFLAADSKGLINPDNSLEYAAWIIKGHLSGATSFSNVKWTGRLLPFIRVVMEAYDSGKEMNEGVLGLVIEGLGRLSKDSPEELTEITQHLLTIINKPQNKSVQDLLIKYTCSVIEDFANRGNAQSYAFALNLLKGLFNTIPANEYHPQLSNSLAQIANNFPAEWRLPAHFSHFKAFMDLLKANKFLEKVDQGTQYALLRCLHCTNPYEDSYIWELIQHISQEDKPKTYDNLVNYLSLIYNTPELVNRVSAIITEHFNKGSFYWVASNKIALSQKILISTSLNANNPKNIAMACKSFDDPIFAPDQELAIKVLEYFADCREDIFKEIFKSAEPLLKYVYKNCLEVSNDVQIRNAAHTSLCKIQNRLSKSNLLNLKIFNEIIGPLLKKKFLKLSQGDRLSDINTLITEALQIISDDLKKDLQNYLNAICIESANRYLITIQWNASSKLLGDTHNYLKEFVSLASSCCPEVGRTFVPRIIKELLALSPIRSIKIDLLMTTLAEYGLYEKVSSGPFQTRRPTALEQHNINIGRYNLEEEIIITRLDKCGTHYSEIEGFDSDLDRKIFAITQWISWDNEVELKVLVDLHIYYSDYLLNKSLITLSGKEFINYLEKLTSIILLKLNQKMITINKDTKLIDTLLKPALEFQNVFMKNLILKASSLSKIYQILKFVSIDTPDPLTFMQKVLRDTHDLPGFQPLLSKLFDGYLKYLPSRGFSEVPIAGIPTDCMLSARDGILKMQSPNQFENVMKKESSDLSVKLTIKILQCVEDVSFIIRKVYVRRHNSHDDMSYFLLTWIEYFSDLHQNSGPEKQAFDDICRKMCKSFEVRPPINQKKSLEKADAKEAAPAPPSVSAQAAKKAKKKKGKKKKGKAEKA